eukprot:TRINITY_DN3206_c1_g1_i1.p1 TRINITY_DN3206_c1_g1~~TRINITY_DN3206_c1_g1_i1.p1  ORF type:complete len:370 (+),score=65.76 TRINITY_DN3206_c1_g1_i1:27-1112(+)
METKQLLIVGLALVTAQLCFGGFSVVARIATASIHPIVFAFLREGFAGPILLTVAVVVDRPQLSVPDFGWLSLLAIVGIYVNQLFFVVGASMVEAIVASILQPAIPVWTTLIATVLRMEKLTWMKALSILFAVGGAATIAISANLNKKSDKTTSIWGIVLLLGNTIASAVYILLMKPILKRGLKPLTITGVAYMVASFVMGGTMLVFGAIKPEANIYNFDIVTLWWTVVYAVVIQSVIGYALVAWSNSKIDASIVSVANCIQPMFATLFASIFLHEQLTWIYAGGAALIIVGLALSSIDKYRQSKSAPEMAPRYGDEGSSMISPYTRSLADYASFDNTSSSNSSTSSGSSRSENSEEQRLL